MFVMDHYSEYLNKIRKINIKFLEEIPVGLAFCEYNHHLLLNKLSEARNAYLILMDKGLYRDAMLIAGHILENCAIIDYIQQDEIKDEGRTKKYISKDLVQTLHDLLGFIDEESPDKATIDTINELVDMLGEWGACILKSKNLDNEQIIEKLKNAETNKEKQHILKNNYCFPVVEDYLRPLRKNIASFYGQPDINNKIILFYASYCKIKHCGASMYTPVLQGNKYHMKLHQYKDVSVIIVSMCLEYTYNKAKEIYLKQNTNNQKLPAGEDRK